MLQHRFGLIEANHIEIAPGQQDRMTPSATAKIKHGFYRSGLVPFEQAVDCRDLARVILVAVDDIVGVGVAGPENAGHAAEFPSTSRTTSLTSSICAIVSVSPDGR